MTVNLSYFGGAGWQFFDNNGKLLTGGKLYTYQAGTSTPATTYTDSTGNTAHSNPIVLDSAGRVNEIWLTSGQSYKFVVKTAQDVLIGTYDDIAGINDISDLLSVLAAPTGAGLIGFSHSATPGGNGTVDKKLRQVVSAKDAPFNIKGDGSDEYTSIAAFCDYCLTNGFDMYFPAGTYDVGEHNWPFGQGLGPTSLKDWKNITVYGEGPTTILRTTSVTGADVLQLNGVKNLHFRDLKVTAILNGSAGAGSNGISITDGWDNLTFDRIWVEDCPYVDKGNYPDGGKGFTIQPGEPTTECGTIRATNMYIKNCVFGVDFAWSLPNAVESNKRPAVWIEAQIEKAYIGVIWQDAGGSNTGVDPAYSLNYYVHAQTINCQRDASCGRGLGLDWNINAFANESAADLRKNPNGDVWASWDSVVDTFTCTFAKYSKFYVHGYKPEQNVKATIGGAVNVGFTGTTSDCQMLIDIGGTATTPIVASNLGGNLVEKSIMQFTTKTCTSAEIPDIFYYPTLNNTIIYGAYHHFTGMQVTGAVNFSYDDGIAAYNSLERDGLTMYFKQTGGSGGDLMPWGIKNNSGTKVFGVRQDGGIATTGTASAASVSGLTKAIPIYNMTGTFIGWVPIYTTAV